MTSKIDGWCVWHPEKGWSKDCYGSQVLVDAKDSPHGEYSSGYKRIPVKIIPHDTWERLMEWCDECASNADGGQWELRVKLHKILTEVEK